MKNFFFLSLIILVYFFTAKNSIGYYHADEHYQIVEFANYILGDNTTADLPWEFREKIRSSLQPYIASGMFYSLKRIGIDDPYLLLFSLRLLSLGLALFVLNYFRKSTSFLIEKKYQTTYMLLTYLLWFIPFLSVRFSSETWSGLLFVLGLSLIIKEDRKNCFLWLAGICFGLSFLCRFQIAIVVFGLLAWMLLIKKEKLSALFKTIIGIAITLALGVLLDSIFYKTWTLSFWNYFYLNLIEDVASDFGVSNWSFYLTKLIYLPSIFIGIPILLSFLFLLAKEYKNPILWVIIPFIIVHTIIPHKEERFLFPIAFLIPLLLVLAYQQMIKLFSNKKIIMTINSVLSILFITSSLIGILVMGSKAAGIGRMEITRYIHQNYKDKKINLVYCTWANPYNPWHSLPTKFYLEDQLEETLVDNLCELTDSLFTPQDKHILIIRKADLQREDCLKILEKYSFTKQIQSIPTWVETINKYYQGFDNRDILVLYSKE